MRIAILLHDLGGGGAERVAVNLANEFINRDISVDVVLLKARGVFLSEVDPRVKIISLNAARLRNSLIPLIRYILDECPDAMIANMWPLTGIALFANKIAKSNMKIAVVEHTNWSAMIKDYSKISAWIMKLGMRCLFPGANCIVAVSRESAKDLAKHCALPENRLHVVYNPIVGVTTITNDEKYHLSYWVIGKHLKLIAVGSLKSSKNYSLLILAFSLLVKKIDAKLLILGEGADRELLESQVRSYGLTNSVFLPGFVSNPNEFLSYADLFVLSSDYEGFGNVLVEALHAGTPVVSTNCPSGPSEILEGGRYGILVPVGDAEKLAAAMLESLNSAHDTQALKARAQNFTIAKAADRYLALLFPGNISEVSNNKQS